MDCILLLFGIYIGTEKKCVPHGFGSFNLSVSTWLILIYESKCYEKITSLHTFNSYVNISSMIEGKLL